jgi:uncharacterized protein with GYD domain
LRDLYDLLEIFVEDLAISIYLNTAWTIADWLYLQSERFYSQLFRVVPVIFLSNFVILGNWTDQGIKNVAELPERLKQSRKMIENAGGKMQYFTTMGKYDFVVVVEIPKDEDMAAIALCTGSMGNIRTTTMKAWTEAETTKLLTAPHA